MVMAYLKKFTSIALSICMLLSIHGFALADNNTQPNTQSDQANQEELNNLYSDFPVQIEKLLETFDWIFPLLFKSLMNFTKNKIFPLNIKCKDYSGSDECIINGNRCSKKQPFAGRG